MIDKKKIKMNYSSSQTAASTIHSVTSLTLASVGITLPIFTLILNH